MRSQIWIPILLSLAACQTAPRRVTASLEPVKIDQITYASALKHKRMDLMRKDCKSNLNLRPEFRAQVLAQGGSYHSLTRQYYTEALRDADATWVEHFQESARTLREVVDQKLRNEGLDPTKDSGAVWAAKYALPYFVADYSAEYFVGYAVGGPLFYDSHGFMPKIFFEIESPTLSLTPEFYLEFTKALTEIGFVGDSKVAMEAGVTRFQFGTIVVRAASIAQAHKAESVAMRYFGPKLVGISRGFDIAQDKYGAKVMDWTSYLCSHDTLSLPEEALKFIRFQD